ncbi:MAG TPA: VCBS repeat-containing protein [Anaerolineales bacterium]|nr:VCBS repeat-containing protein [Anaerolineales bacterium]
MKNEKLLHQMFSWVMVILLLTGCGAPAPVATSVPTQTATSIPSATATVADTATAAPTEPVALWVDVTDSTIGKTKFWSNKVELADINSDGLVDVLFANGGDYEMRGLPEASQVFLNQGPDEAFKEVTEEVFGPTLGWVRVIKVRDVNNDGQPDIMKGATFQSQSQLYLSEGSGKFTNVTTTHLPQIEASIGDLEFGDVDGDADLDIVLADWGAGSPMSNEGGRTMLWLNDGTGQFSDATNAQMPDVLVRFSWELEFVDVDNDYDLDILVSCKQCSGSYLFENDGGGTFTDVTEGRLPQFRNNYDFEAMDLNNDNYLDLLTINDGPGFAEHIFLNNQQGGFEDATEELWPTKSNFGCDDNMHAFLDFDSDSDADFLTASLDCEERLLVNDGAGNLQLFVDTSFERLTGGTLGIAVSDLNGDHKLDIVLAQGEAPGSIDEKVYFGEGLVPDTAEPVITLVETITTADPSKPVQIRARIHDNKSPTMPQDWQSVLLRWTADGQTQDVPMQWYGEYLWRGTIDEPPAGTFTYEVCATDAAGNEACSSP